MTPKGIRCSPDWHCPIGEWQNESVVMGADEIDLATHVQGGQWDPASPPMDYYG